MPAPPRSTLHLTQRRQPITLSQSPTNLQSTPDIAVSFSIIRRRRVSRSRFEGRVLGLTCFSIALAASFTIPNDAPLSKPLVPTVLLLAAFTICCGSYQGLYRDPSNTISVDLHKNKIRLSLGAYTIEGTYKLDGNKIIASGNFGPSSPTPASSPSMTTAPSTARPAA